MSESVFAGVIKLGCSSRTSFVVGAIALALWAFMPVDAAHAMSGVCIDSPQTDCSLGDGPPQTIYRRRYYSPPVYRGPSPAEIRRQQRHRSANVINDRGLRYYKEKNYQAAAEEFRRALRYWNNSAIRRNLRNAEASLRNENAYKENEAGNVYYKNGQVEKAIEYYKKALRNSPNDSVIRKNLRDAEGDLHDKQQLNKASQDIRAGISDLQKSISGGPSSGEPGPYTKTNPFGISSDPGSSHLGFMTTTNGVAPGHDRKAMDQLNSAAANGLSFMKLGASDEGTKEGVGTPFDAGGKKNKPVKTAVPPIGPGRQFSAVPPDVYQLPPAVEKALAGDQGYQALKHDRSNALSHLKAVVVKLSAAEMKLKSASSVDKSKVEVEIANLRNERDSAKNQIKTDEVHIDDKVRNGKFKNPEAKKQATKFVLDH